MRQTLPMAVETEEQWVELRMEPLFWEALGEQQAQMEAMEPLPEAQAREEVAVEAITLVTLDLAETVEASQQAEEVAEVPLMMLVTLAQAATARRGMP